jgi:DNA-directed RNA polymerase subunit beta'
MGHINLVVPVAHIWYFRSLTKQNWLPFRIPSKKLDMIIYYERYVVIQQGIAKKQTVLISKNGILTEEEYLDILETLPIENQYLDDSDPNKFIAKMGAEAVEELLKESILDAFLSICHKAHNETSKQRRTEALKRLNVVEALEVLIQE